MKLVPTFITVLFLATASCNHTFKEYNKESFPAYSWQQGQEIEFNPKIEDITKTYQITLGLRHVYGLKLSSMTVNVRMISPSGKETSKDYTLKIMKSEDQYEGSCAGDLCDLEVLVEKSMNFDETGEYRFILTHKVQTERVPGVIEFGLIIDESN